MSSLNILSAMNKSVTTRHTDHEAFIGSIMVILSETSLLDSLIESCVYGKHIPHASAAILQKEVRLFAQSISLYKESVESTKGALDDELIAIVGEDREGATPHLSGLQGVGRKHIDRKVEVKRSSAPKEGTVMSDAHIPSTHTDQVAYKGQTGDDRMKKETLRAVEGNMSDKAETGLRHAVKSTHDIKDIKPEPHPNKEGESAEIANRKDIIMNVVRSRGKVAVSDILPYVKDCSEKTIQRDLIKMVTDGLLVKEGERRWSRYSLKS